jgi:hypothetical protein
MRNPNRRYLREFLPAMAVYVLIMLLAWPRLRALDSPAGRSLAALLPMIPLLFAGRAIVRRILSGDELELRVHLIAASVAAGVVGIGSMTAGFLAAARVVELDGSVLTWVLPALIVVWGLALGWASRRHGMSGSP